MKRHLAIAFIVLFTPYSVSALEIHAQGLFKNMAVLVIDGRRHTLRAGKSSPEGVLLVAADRQRAVIEYQGKRQSLSLSRSITTQYNEVETREVAIRRNAFKQYITTASINQKRIQVLVDTGANTMVMNSEHARRLAVPYEKGIPSQVRTASGVAPAYLVKLRSVAVGEVSAQHIEGVVIEGQFPEYILLGMSFLEQVDMREENGILYLKGRF